MLLLTFTAGPNRYGVDVARVVELVPHVKLHRIPYTAVPVVGLLAYRGKAIPVVDLCLLLESVPCQDRLSTRIIVVNDARTDQNSPRVVEAGPSEGNALHASGTRYESLIGLLAERVSDLSHVYPERLVTTPVDMTLAPYLSAIARTDVGIVHLLAVDKLRDTPGWPSTLRQDATLNSSSDPEHPKHVNWENEP
jgi:chemotaxis-related protein WspB